MKKLITILAVSALAAGSAFADKEGEKKEGEKKPRGERTEKGERKRPEGGRGAGMKALDTNEDGKISFEEFKASPRAKDRPEDKLKEFFGRMDADNDGFITQADHEARRKAAGDRPERPEGGKKRPEGKKKPEGDKKPE